MQKRQAKRRVRTSTTIQSMRSGSHVATQYTKGSGATTVTIISRNELSHRSFSGGLEFYISYNGSVMIYLPEVQFNTGWRVMTAFLDAVMVDAAGISL